MVVKIYGYNIPVFTTLKELDIPYEYVPVNMKENEHKSKEWIENMHPFGQVPVMIDDGFKLIEARAISRYLVRKYRPESNFVPSMDDLEKYGLFEQAMSIEAFDWHPGAFGIVFEIRSKQKMGEVADQKVVDEAIAKFEGTLEGYERILSKQKYIAGDEFTLADVCHLMYGQALSILFKIEILSDKSKRPNVARWTDDITARPSWVQVLKEWKEYMGLPA